MHEIIKMKCLEKTWDFYWWRRGCLRHPQALTLVLLGYFLGWHAWHPQAWALVHSSSYHIILSLHLKISFIQNFTQSSLATLVHSKDNKPLGFSFKTQKLSLKTQDTVAITSKISIHQKEPKKKSIKRQMQIMAEICQNRQARENWFFRRPSVAQIEKC